ncbi:MAG: cobalt/nickel transport system ATP-binding protein [Fusobacteria bacterium]|nr:MAG: cobalt/nickel transport system ATP-binding protein [Fusobacteriota bacterium]KAF0228816.1 MAG: cobalt/nickel transport system ATP-binding [Fusobacteriota bacterium]
MNAIEIKNLSWRYERAENYAIEDLNLIIEENQFIGIVGPNEAGKTTLASAIKGIIPSEFNGIYKGTVELFGKKVTDCSTRELAKTVGMVFADPDSQFTSMSVEEEISFGLENIGCTVEEIDERIKWVSELTNIEELLEKPPYDLSGGQKQRVAIASIIAMKPRIIILDEPTSMLDPISKDMIFSLLQTMKEKLKLTIIVIEHNIEKLVELSDKMILVNDGKIEKYTDTDVFFQDIEFLDSRSIRIPGAIRFMDMIDKDKDDLPTVHLQDIVKTIKEELRR